MISANKLGIKISNRLIFNNVSFSIQDGDKVALIGTNGSGKTTLLKIINNEISHTFGSFDTQNAKISYFKQFDEKGNERTIEDIMSEQSKNSDFIKLLNNFGLKHLNPKEKISDLSQGEAAKLRLVQCLSEKSDIYILDEPTNNLDLESVHALENFLNISDSTFLVVTHDRRFIRNSLSIIFELIGSDKGINVYGLGYDEYLKAREQSYLAGVRKYKEEKKKIHNLEDQAKKIKSSGVRADSGGKRRKDNDKSAANYRAQRASNHLSAKASAIEARLKKSSETRSDKPIPPVDLNINLESDKGLPYLVNIDNYQTKTKTLSFAVKTGEKVFMSGNNGAGKTTLLHKIESSKSDDSIKRHEKLSAFFIDQEQSLPFKEKSVIENVSYYLNDSSQNQSIKLLLKLNLDRDVVFSKKTSSLSGGERAKILIAILLALKPNLLILDEPTNNLDIPTIDGLQNAISSYSGAVLLVSHDREFVEGIGADKIIKI